MNKEQIIDVLKNGFNVQNFGRKFIPFGQWPEEVQAKAREIGKNWFECYQETENFGLASGENFCPSSTYRLRHDWQEKPKEIPSLPPGYRVITQETFVKETFECPLQKDGFTLEGELTIDKIEVNNSGIATKIYGTRTYRKE